MSQPEEQQNQGQQQHGTDLGAELRELGQQIEQTVRSAIESDRAKQIQRDIAAGMKEIGAQMQSALQAIQDNPRVQNLAERGQQALHQAQQSQAAHDFQEALARGIAQLNEQLSTFAARLRTNEATGAPPASSEPPSTGETTRLDEEQK